MAQETICQLENPDYGRYSLKTLKRLAAALDVALVVRFAPFTELAAWIADPSSDTLAVPGFEEDVATPSSPDYLPIARTLLRAETGVQFASTPSPPLVFDRSTAEWISTSNMFRAETASEQVVLSRV